MSSSCLLEQQNFDDPELGPKDTGKKGNSNSTGSVRLMKSTVCDPTSVFIKHTNVAEVRTQPASVGSINYYRVFREDPVRLCHPSQPVLSRGNCHE